MKTPIKKLQHMIDQTVRASNAYYARQRTLNDWCREHYGFEPGDIDADQIIDGVFGANGLCDGMSAEEFDQIMRQGK